jgi:bacillolysin
MKKCAIVAFVVLAAPGCDAEQGLPDDVTTEQRDAFQRFESSTGEAWQWTRHDASKMHLSSERSGRTVLRAGDDPIRATIGVLAENRALFRMHDPSIELRPVRAYVDALGMAHARFEQTAHGVVVDGAELTAHYDALGHLASIDTSYVSDLDALDVQPILGERDAVASARAALGEESESGDVALVVHTGAAPRLAYRLHLRPRATPALWVMYVDARTGELIDSYDDLQHVQASGTTALGQTVTFEVTQTPTGFVMTDTSGGVSISTFTAKNQQVAPGTAVTSTALTTWDTGVPGAGAAVDAHVNAAIVFKYYKERHARNAINGVGGALVSTAHFGNAYDNASWDPQRQLMIYGDGGDVFRPLSVGLDVVAHEFTHGVTGATSNLEYRSQSGALNEAVSDIFAAFIEHAAKPDVVNNWKIGEVVVKQGGALRDMANPGAVSFQQPANMSQYVNTLQDNGGVHINSGIINNAAFLMTVGGTNPASKTEVRFGIGWDKSEKLWYRANTTYFQRTTNFAQAAQGLLQAAKDLELTPAETNIVDCAFKATGILQGACATIVDPKVESTPSAAPPIGSAAPQPPTTTGTDAPEQTAVPQRRVRRAITTTSSGCASAPGDSSPASFALFALTLIALRRRKTQP